jgi:hypothetical protein
MGSESKEAVEGGVEAEFLLRNRMSIEGATLGPIVSCNIHEK